MNIFDRIFNSYFGSMVTNKFNTLLHKIILICQALGWINGNRNGFLKTTSPLKIKNDGVKINSYLYIGN
jgi:hypothetical protein